MLIIGHRGAKGLAPENTLESLRAGYDAGADILEFDVRHTKDNVLVVIHDARLTRTHNKRVSVHGMTYQQLQEYTGDLPVPTLQEVLDEYFGLVLLNIEVKTRGTGILVARMLKNKYVKRAADWDNVFISAYSGYELSKIRKYSKRINLAMLHIDNPFLFIAYHRKIKFTAVGFHRLYVNRLALEIAKKLRLFTYAYTVNRTAAMDLLENQHIDGVVTDYPDRFRSYIARHPSVHDA